MIAILYLKRRFEMKYSRIDEMNARDMLRKYLDRESIVYTVLRHVSKSGMMREIDLYTIKDGGLIYLTGYAAVAMGDNRNKNTGAIRVPGCGMDMGFHLVYN
jgi:hypothetical protein